MTAGVILDSYLRPTQVLGFDQGNRLVGADLDEGGLFVLHASLFMHGDSIFEATLGRHYGHPAIVGSLALVIDAMSLGTCKTEAVIGDQFEDFR